MGSQATGSGKSYTMQGGRLEHRGLLPRVCEGLFAELTAQQGEPAEKRSQDYPPDREHDTRPGVGDEASLPQVLLAEAFSFLGGFPFAVRLAPLERCDQRRTERAENAHSTLNLLS